MNHPAHDSLTTRFARTVDPELLTKIRHAYSGRFTIFATSAQCGAGINPLSQPEKNGGKEITLLDLLHAVCGSIRLAGQ